MLVLQLAVLLLLPSAELLLLRIVVHPVPNDSSFWLFSAARVTYSSSAPSCLCYVPLRCWFHKSLCCFRCHPPSCSFCGSLCILCQTIRPLSRSFPGSWLCLCWRGWDSPIPDWCASLRFRGSLLRDSPEREDSLWRVSRLRGSLSLGRISTWARGGARQASSAMTANDWDLLSNKSLILEIYLFICSYQQHYYY